MRLRAYMRASVGSGVARALLESVLTAMGKRAFHLSLVVLASVAMLGHSEASASNAPSVIEIAPPPAAFATDASALRTAAAGEIKKLDAVLLREHRRVVVSLALAAPSSDPIVCSVNATVRDARTGVLIAVVEAATRAGGPVSAEQRKELAYSAVRSAVRRVPSAVVTKK